MKSDVKTCVVWYISLSSSFLKNEDGRLIYQTTHVLTSCQNMCCFLYKSTIFVFQKRRWQTYIVNNTCFDRISFTHGDLRDVHKYQNNAISKISEMSVSGFIQNGPECMLHISPLPPAKTLTRATRAMLNKYRLPATTVLFSHHHYCAFFFLFFTTVLFSKFQKRAHLSRQLEIV